MKTRKAPDPSDVSLELIAASWVVGIQMTAEICQKVLDEFGMPVVWALSIVVSSIKRKGDIRNCSRYGAVKLLEHGMKVVERVIDKRLRGIASVDQMLFGAMPEIGTIDAVFILRRLKEKNHAKGKKLYMCLVDLEEALDRVPRKLL